MASTNPRARATRREISMLAVNSFRSERAVERCLLGQRVRQTTKDAVTHAAKQLSLEHLLATNTVDKPTAVKRAQHRSQKAVR